MFQGEFNFCKFSSQQSISLWVYFSLNGCSFCLRLQSLCTLCCNTQISYEVFELTAVCCWFTNVSTSLPPDSSSSDSSHLEKKFKWSLTNSSYYNQTKWSSSVKDCENWFIHWSMELKYDLVTYTMISLRKLSGFQIAGKCISASLEDF